MPLNGYSYLVAQGWSGKGTGLRQGAISRPLAIPQKKTLSGLGKDRDEAFPFWDHLFTAAASTIKIKVTSDDEDSDDSQSSSAVTIKRTTTGILSNRRPVSGTAANSGSSTPNSWTPRLSLIAKAKREAAKQGLYSRFFRGPVLGPNEDHLSDGPCRSGSSSGKPKAPAVDEVKLKVSQSPECKSVEDSEDWKKNKWQKKALREGDKRTTEKDRTREGVFVEQSEEAMARKARKRDERAAKIKAREDNCTEREDSRQKSKGKRKRESAKNETAAVVEETFADTRNNSLAYNVTPASDDMPKKQNDALDQHTNIARLDAIRKKKRKRIETS